MLRMIRSLRSASKEAWKPVLRPVGEMALQARRGSRRAPGTAGGETGLLGQPQHAPALAEAASAQQQPEHKDIVLDGPSKRPFTTSPEDDQRSRVVTRLTEENPATVAEIIQIWLNEGNKNYG